jgi:hypothetical protein
MAASYPISSGGYVYFIRAPINGLIKIGHTRNHPHVRLRELRANSPVPLKFLGCLPGDLGKGKEHELHVQFRHLRQHHEWFEPGPDLLDFIENYVDEWPNESEPPGHEDSQRPDRVASLPSQVMWLTDAESAKLRAELGAKYGWHGL